MLGSKATAARAVSSLRKPEAFEDPAVVTAATLARDARERYEALGVEF